MNPLEDKLPEDEQEDNETKENNFSLRDGWSKLSENEKIILGRDARKDDYFEQESIDNNKKPDLNKIADRIKQIEKFVTFRDNETIFYYRNGTYVRNGETRIKEISHRIMNGKESRQAVNEIIGKIQRSTYIDREIFFEESETHLIVLENGILDLDTLELKEHDPGFYSFIKFPVSYIAEKGCENIAKFLSETVRAEDIPVLQEWTGYNLWTFGYPAQKALILVGEGGNGKSTFIGLIEALIGKNNRSAVSLHELEDNRFASHDLFGKASNLYPDLPDKDLKSTGRFKMLTGGDPIRAEDKNIKAFTFHNVAKLTFSCNKIPRVPEDTIAFFRRFIIIEFPYSFEGSDKEDRGLKEKLISDKDEMSGFLNWALEGLKRLRANGWHFSDGKTVDQVREEYIVRSDPYKAFVIHTLIENSDSFVIKDDLYEAYKVHCEIHKLGHKSRDSFFKNFKDQFAQGKINTEHPEMNGKRVWIFRGIKLRDRSNWCKPLNEEEAEAKIQPGGVDEAVHKVQVVQKEVQGVLTVQGDAPHLSKINDLKDTSQDLGSDNEKQQNENLNEIQEGGSTNSHNPLNPLNPSDSTELENNGVQNEDWQYFKIKESFAFQEYIYQKGRVSKFPVLKAGEYIKKGFLELPCPHGQIWDPVEKQCITDGGSKNES